MLKAFRLVALLLPLIAAPVANAQLLNTGLGDGTTVRSAGQGIGQAVSVGTSTTLGQIGFYVGSPDGGDIKFLIFNANSTSLLFSTVVHVDDTADGTLVLSDPFSFALNAGSTYTFGVTSNSTFSASYFFPAQPVTQNGLTITGTNTNYSNYTTPVVGGSGNTTVALELLGPTTATPEPQSLVLLATGLAGVFGVVRRTRRA